MASNMAVTLSLLSTSTTPLHSSAVTGLFFSASSTCQARRTGNQQTTPGFQKLNGTQMNGH